MGLRAVSGYFPGILRILSRQYASYIPLHPIWGKYLDYMPVLCRQYMAYLQGSYSTLWFINDTGLAVIK